jgi:hypothetical protein
MIVPVVIIFEVVIIRVLERSKKRKLEHFTVIERDSLVCLFSVVLEIGLNGER